MSHALHDHLMLTVAGTTFMTTAILEAGRVSLDSGCRPIEILYEGADQEHPSGLRPAAL